MDARKESATYGRLMKDFESTLDRYLETGVLLLTDPKVDTDADYTTRRRQYREQAPIMPHVLTRRLVRSIGKDIKRPVVVAEHTWWGNAEGVVLVTLRKTKRNAPLVSDFLLMEKFAGNKYDAHRGDGQFDVGPVRRREDGTNWYIHFVGAEGYSRFEEWLSHITTHPDCRKVLKLPPSTNNVISLAA